MHYKNGDIQKVYYSGDLKAVRIDSQSSKDTGPAYVDNPVKVSFWNYFGHLEFFCKYLFKLFSKSLFTTSIG